jgi:hypothetical protein
MGLLGFDRAYGLAAIGAEEEASVKACVQAFSVRTDPVKKMVHCVGQLDVYQTLPFSHVELLCRFQGVCLSRRASAVGRADSKDPTTKN